MNKTILQTHIDLLNECKRQNKMLQKLIELNMNDMQDIVDQRDWYYERYRQLKEAIQNFYDVKCRYNTQIAAAQMFEAIGLTSSYPENYKKIKAPKPSIKAFADRVMEAATSSPVSGYYDPMGLREHKNH